MDTKNITLSENNGAIYLYIHRWQNGEHRITHDYHAYPWRMEPGRYASRVRRMVRLFSASLQRSYQAQKGGAK